MYCNRCGNKVSPDSQFCNRCGNRIETGNRSQRGRSIPSPTTRPARRRMAVEDDFDEEPYFDEEYDDENPDNLTDDDAEVVQDNDETVIFTIYPAFYEVGGQYFLAVVLSVVIMALFGVLKLPLWIGIAFAGACFIRPIYHHIQHNHTIYKLTTVKIEIRSGLFSKTSRNIPLRHIQDVLVSETFQGRLIGVGDVMIDTAADESKIPMRNIKSPRKYADLILHQLQYWN